ncbi:MAG: hypothetical protein J5722_05255 [Oscillospiraceae bacterium]|nr:hypothetical protein [Oscillospiraceae bacterium]
MKSKKFTVYWLFVLIGVLAVSFYPLYMGTSVIADMLRNGTVLKENYPKYVIPYTPLAVAIIIGILLMPLCIKLLKRAAVFGGSAVSIAVFFGAEFWFERHVVVTAEETVAKLRDWQMFMCYQAPDTVTDYKTHSAVEILMGEYNPAFKLHFYLISVLLILALLNCFYGFAQIIRTGNQSRKRALILQSVSAAAFLGLCILACFTAFWRDGSIRVSALSASLMSAFFILMGLTAGIFTGSLLLNCKRTVMLRIPAVVSAAVTLLMYIGEMILLHGHLYRFGEGFFFDGLPAIVLAPVDLLVILASGIIMYLLMRAESKNIQKVAADTSSTF